MRLDFDSGFIRVVVGERVAYRFEFVVPDGSGVIVVADDDVAPSRTATLECRADGLWFACICEVPGEHWTFGLEAFGLRYDDVVEARAGGFGDRLPVGIDLEWESDVDASTADGTGRVRGDVLVGSAVFAVDGYGRFDASLTRS